MWFATIILAFESTFPFTSSQYIPKPKKRKSRLQYVVSLLKDLLQPELGKYSVEGSSFRTPIIAIFAKSDVMSKSKTIKRNRIGNRNMPPKTSLNFSYGLLLIEFWIKGFICCSCISAGKRSSSARFVVMSWLEIFESSLKKKKLVPVVGFLFNQIKILFKNR